jgi:predicted metal-dependent hydrolase
MGLFGTRYADGQAVDIGGLTVRLRVSARARRISLRVDKARGEAVAVAPSARHLADAAAFARLRRDWLADRLTVAPAARPSLILGDRLAVFGVNWRLEPDGRRPCLLESPDEPLRLVGCGAGAVDPQLVVRAIRRQAGAVFEARAAAHCAALGAPMPPIALTDARTRWGSCTPAQAGRPATIRLSWRLALAPFAVADYVVAHECAHLREANHGPRFWALVRGLVGDERQHRHWLRTQGASLHAILPRAEG